MRRSCATAVLLNPAAISPCAASPGRGNGASRVLLGGYAILACLLALGCQDAPRGPATVPVTGVVTWNKQPLAGASVIFYPADGSANLKPVQATTQEDGTFSVQTHVEGSTYKPGMQPGEYVVTLSKTEPQPPGVMLPPKELLPPKYSVPQSTPLRAVVSENAENHFEFPI